MMLGGPGGATSADGPSHCTQVARHNTERDCWLHDGTHVYDVTKYLPMHQGGTDAILKFAGRDASKPIAGPQHPADVGTLLQRYCIGTLRQ